MSAPALVLETSGIDDYALLDSGGGRKLERFGQFVLDRPEEQAMWAPNLGAAEWARADASFTGNVEEEGAGRWQRRPGMPDQWICRHEDLTFSCRLTSFRHVGAFPEQAAHFAFLRERLATAGERPAILNLFGYTGLASLVAAKAGAEVVHVDASKTAMAWARANQQLSHLDDKPIRWIVDDAVKFALREVRRGRRYDGIVLDPPKYGRGPKGEVWELFPALPEMLTLCRDLLKPERSFLVLTAYAIRASFLSLHRLCEQVLGPNVESGELALRSKDDALLATSLFSRWTAP